ncbi:M20 peptidase aminoacylase family protein [Tepidibacillus infernus]|uniref:M20 peptidase aminoacylase family protein n=1 Tax=Tepidibacillus infernus TaxID=1806172 RepID=UPI003B6EC4D9
MMELSNHIRANIKEKMMENFLHLHTHPELSWQEVNTTQFLKERLQALGLETITFEDTTGVIGIWDNIHTDHKLTVALRSDMDALWQEVDGKWCANHSCGHDAHMAMVLGALEILKVVGFQPKGKFKLIFQPAEEKGTGALKMIEKGVVDDVDYLYGVHLRPIQELPFGKVSSAIYNGAALLVKGEIHGKAAHGARPHLGVNVIDVASHFIHGLHTIYTDPMVPATVKMTRLNAGGENVNIIPDFAEFALDLRAQTNQVLDELYQKIESLSQNISTMYGAKIKLLPSNKIAAAEVNEEAKKIMSETIKKTLGSENAVNGIVTPGGEDFHFYTLERPTIKATMLGVGCDLEPGLHHPNMTFNHQAIFLGAEILAQAVIDTFERGGKD